MAAKSSRILTCALVLALASATLAPSAFPYSQSQFDSVTTSDENQVYRIREQEIDQLRIVLGRRFAETRRPDILLRLAELYVEKYRFYFLKENEIHQRLLSQGQKPKKVEHERSRKYLASATGVCTEILRSKVRFAKMDQVYYFLGYNSLELGHDKEAQKYFHKIIEVNPRSVYAPEAYRNLGEKAFESKDYRRAIQYYENAASYTKIPSYPRNVYKLAWAYFKVKRYNDALQAMRRVVTLTNSDEYKDKFVSLRDEALGDLVGIYAEAGKYKEASEYFTKVSDGAEIYVRALKKLSSVYERQGRYAQGLAVNEQLLKEYGDSRPDLTFDVLGSNVELYRRKKDIAGEQRGLEKLVQFFVKHRKEITKNSDTAADYIKTKSYLRNRATEIHKLAREKKNAQYFVRAAELYKVYIDAFLTDDDSAESVKELSEIRTYRVDALLTAKREEEAMPVLAEILDAEGDAKYRREAGATLLDLQIKRLDAAVKAKSPNLEALTKNFQKTAEKFEEIFPKDKLIPELKFKRAQLVAVRAGKSSEALSSDARDELLKFIREYPSRHESVDSAVDLLNDAAKRKDDSDVRELSEEFRKNAALLSADKEKRLQNFMSQLVARESFENVQKIEKSENYNEAAAQYEKLAKQSLKQDAEVSLKAYNNAAVSYEKGGQLSDAFRVYRNILRDLPKQKEMAASNLKRLAAVHLWNSRFAESAQAYAELSEMAVYSAAEKKEFANTAYGLYAGLGRVAEASRLEIANRKDCDSACHDRAMDLAELLYERKQYGEVVSHLKGYLHSAKGKARVAQANTLLAEAYGNLGDDKKRMQHIEAAAKKTNASPLERNLAARAAYLLVEPTYQRFAGMELSLPETRLRNDIQRKLGALEALVTRYQTVVSYGDGDWGLAALKKLGDAFALAAESLRKLSPPSSTSAEQAAVFKKGLDGVAGPLESKSVEYLKQGFATGLKLDVTSGSFVRLYRDLSTRLPRNYPPAFIGTTLSTELSTYAATDADPRAKAAADLTKNSKDPTGWIELGVVEAQAGHTRLARLLFSQAQALSKPRTRAYGKAANNLGHLLAQENRLLEALQEFKQAAGSDESSDLNMSKVYLRTQHFAAALKHLKGSNPELLAVARLGNGDLRGAIEQLKALNAEDSDQFGLWYNWGVWAALAGSSDEKEDARDLVNKRKSSLKGDEAAQAALLLSLLGEKK